MNTQSFNKVTVVRGKSRRRIAEFVPACVWESSDPTNPLHGSLVGATSESVVVSDGHRSIHALRSELVTE